MFKLADVFMCVLRVLVAYCFTQSWLTLSEVANLLIFVEVLKPQTKTSLLLKIPLPISPSTFLHSSGFPEVHN